MGKEGARHKEDVDDRQRRRKWKRRKEKREKDIKVRNKEDVS